jgi:integrase
MPRPHQLVHVHGIQDRRSQERVKKPWVVRWSIDGVGRSRSFRTRVEADRYRTQLLIARQDGDRFDNASGEPETWKPSPEDQTVFNWAQRWLSEQWPEWQPRTRHSAGEALTKLVMLAVDVPPTPALSGQLHRFVRKALPPNADIDDPACRGWLERHSLRVSSLDANIVARIDRGLGLNMDGEPFAASTANRTRIVARACVSGAVDAGLIAVHPWPPRSRSRARRKVARRKTLDLRRLPDPETMARAIDAIVNDQPGSRVYRVMTAVAYYAGLRPSEVAMLRVKSVELPPDGWGRVHVTEADVWHDQPGEPKTGPRMVPIPPVLVGILRTWIVEQALTGDDQLLFRTTTGTMPAQSNWGRAWRRALRSIGQPPLRVYDCRHAAATTWLRSGLPLGETARRLGHSVDTLVTNYVGALQDEEEVGNLKIERFLDGSSDR